jgi:hypothetical protein
MFDEMKAIAEIEERNRLRCEATLPLLAVEVELDRMRLAYEKLLVKAAMRGPIGEAQRAKLVLELGEPMGFISGMSFYAALETDVRQVLEQRLGP